MKQPDLKKKESEKMQFQQDQIKYNPNPEENSWCLSRLLFTWTNKVISKGVEKNTEFKEEDFFDIEERDKFDTLRKDLYQAKKDKPSANLLSQIMHQDKGLMVFYCFISIIANGLQFAGPLFLNLLIKLLQDETVSDDEFWEQGITYVVILFICFFLRAFFQQHQYHGTTRITYNIVQKVLALLFDKTLHLSAQASKYQDAGKMTNLVSINLVEIVMFFMFAFNAMAAPFMIIVSSIYIVFELSWVGLIGPFCIFAVSVYVKYMQDKQGEFRKKAFVYIDRRSKKVQEFLGGVKAIKYYAWEKFVTKQLDEIRKQEMEVLYDISYTMGKVTVISQITPALTSVVIFGIYIALGEEMTPERAFTVIALLNIMQMPFQQIVGSYQQFSNALVATERVNHYLNTESFDDNYCIKSADSEGNVLAIQDCKFSWNSNYNEEHNSKNPDMLRYKILAQDAAQKKQKNKKNKAQIKEDIIKELEREIQTQNKETTDLEIQNLKIKKGEFIGVVGKFSSGKSSLLHAIIGEMKKLNGQINIEGEMSFIPQKAWIRSCTLKENILFGLPFNKEKYDRVIKESQLQMDIDQLPGGEETEIGEKGVNLSGGQKQRVQIARALYADNEIMVADDVLSALDSHVGKKVFHKAFKSKKGQKTTIFVTHALHYLPHFDKIAIMEEGKLVEFGTYQELKNNENLKKIIVDHKKEGKSENDDIKEDENLDYVDSDDENQPKKFDSKKSLENKNPKEDQNDNNQIKIEEKSEEEKQNEKDIENDKKKKGAMVKVEKKSKGGVPMTIYYQFIALGGYGTLILAMTTFAMGQFAKMATDWWLGTWSVYTYSQELDNEDGWYLLIYGGIAITSAILFLLRTKLFTLFTINASRSVFQGLFERILYAPQKFFDTTPLGRIVSRLSADINMVDWGITFSLQACVFGILVVVSACILISIITPWFLIMFAILSILYVILIKKFLTAAREMKKLNNNLRGPLIGGQAEAADGLTIIRSFKQQNMITQQFDKIADNWYRSAMNEQWCLRWSGLITDIISAFVIGGAAIFGIIAKSQGSDNMAALLGLSLTYALQIALSLPLTIMLLANLELSMDSVQRILDYTNDLEQERDHFQPKKPQDWPKQGALQVKDIRYRYREGLPLVLKGISFEVQKQEKIGVIGRTGSGKSTLTLGLLRILELAEKSENDEPEFSKGQIVLDGINIENIGLTELRNSIAMIPQDPVLFSGTVRRNIDPFQRYTNQEVIDALKQVSLLETFLQKLKQAKEEAEKEAQQKEQAKQQQQPHQVLEVKKQPQKQQKQQEFDPELQEVLDMPVENEGKNFSQGERQLISMARVLVRQPKMLVMDEATASIDEKTDQFIQQMIKTQFSNTTVITIAHRLNTIMQYDKILVLDKGEIKAWGSPQEMLADEQSYLYTLVKGQGNEYYEQMQAMANNAESEKQKLLALVQQKLEK